MLHKKLPEISLHFTTDKRFHPNKGNFFKQHFRHGNVAIEKNKT